MAPPSAYAVAGIGFFPIGGTLFSVVCGSPSGVPRIAAHCRHVRTFRQYLPLEQLTRVLHIEADTPRNTVTLLNAYILSRRD